jgi:hypothetical protein
MPIKRETETKRKVYKKRGGTTKAVTVKKGGVKTKVKKRTTRTGVGVTATKGKGGGTKSKSMTISDSTGRATKTTKTKSPVGKYTLKKKTTETTGTKGYGPSKRVRGKTSKGKSSTASARRRVITRRK